MKEQLKDSFDILVDKAKSGAVNAQYKLAKAFYYGDGVKRSLPLANYWAYKAATNDDNYKSEISEFYYVTSAPHLTGNEFYESYGRYYNVSQSEYGFWGSLKVKGHHDVDKNNPSWERRYLILRIIVLYFVVGSYRMYGNYLMGQEKTQFKEYFKWLIPDIVVLGVIIYYGIRHFI